MDDGTALLRSLLEGHTDRDDEARIVGLMRAAPAARLNAMLTGVDVDRLMSSVDDRVFGPDRRSELLDLLTRDRVSDLGTESLANLIHALQAGRTGLRDEEAVRDMMRARGGAALTELKNAVDSRPDGHDLEGLVFADIDDEGIRRAILDHIAAEAASLGTLGVKVLSDIDDTVFARLHESRYPKGTLIPGCLAFYDALDAGPAGDPVDRSHVTFVTARPGDVFGLIEGLTLKGLRSAGIDRASVLTGAFSALLDKGDMADKKLENVAHMRALFPEYDTVFVGDSGQADPIVGARMVADHGEPVRAVFIHDVVATPPAERAGQAERGLTYVDTFVGAAAAARVRGLISPRGLAGVIAETREGMDAVEWSSPEQERDMREMVERDVAAAGG